MFWTMKKAGYRAVQVGLGLAMRVIPWQKPVLVEHPGAIGALPAALAEDGLHNAGNERHSQGPRFYQGSVRAAPQSRPRRIAASARCRSDRDRLPTRFARSQSALPSAAHHESGAVSQFCENADEITTRSVRWALFLYAAWQICYTECTRMINHEGAII